MSEKIGWRKGMLEVDTLWSTKWTFRKLNKKQ